MAGWLIGASLIDLRQRKGARASAFAAVLAHAGLGVTLMGVAGTTLWRSEALDLVAPGETMQVGPYTLRFDGVTSVEGPNYQAQRAHVALLDGAKAVAMLEPEKRVYPAEQQEVSDTAIRTTGLQDLYLALGDDRGGGRFILRAYVSPLAPFIWLGALVMALGGGLSLWGRLRSRAAAPLQRRHCRRNEIRARLLLMCWLFAAPALAVPVFLFVGSARAAPVADTFANPAVEARARNLQRELRCLVCQGESIDESGADLAADLRHLVRQQIAQGRSDRQIKDFLHARYGDFILMQPPLKADTWLLWLAPFLVLATAGGVAALTIRRARARALTEVRRLIR